MSKESQRPKFANHAQQSKLRAELQESIEYLEELEWVIESLGLRAECGTEGAEMVKRLKAGIASMKKGAADHT